MIWTELGLAKCAWFRVHRLSLFLPFALHLSFHLSTFRRGWQGPKKYLRAQKRVMKVRRIEVKRELCVVCEFMSPGRELPEPLTPSIQKYLITAETRSIWQNLPRSRSDYISLAREVTRLAMDPKCLACSACRYLQPTDNHMVTPLPTESQRYSATGLFKSDY